MGFQRSEFLLERGQVDRIVNRDKMRDELARLVAYQTGADPVAAYGPWETAEAEVAPQPKKRGRRKAKEA